jgi:AraC-like DNA-binding protein
MKTEEARLWMPPELTGVGAFQARFVTYRFARHAHEGWLLLVMEAGGEAFDHRGARHVATPGSLAVLEPEAPHTGEAASDLPWSYRALHLSREWFPGPMVRFPSPVLQDPPLYNRIRALHQHLEGPVEPLWAEAELQGVVETLARRHASSVPPERILSSHPHALATVREYLEANYRQRVSLQDLSDTAGLGRFHLLRLFKRTTGFTPYEYLVQIRVRRAMQLLRQGQAATKVAFATGFADQAHLNRHFKRLVGLTPGAFARTGQHRSSENLR